MRFSFEDQTLDTSRRELRRNGQPVALEPQVFDLLVFLIENRDRVVSKDDVLDAVWRGRTVSESALTARINAARTALGDNGAAQRLIRTLPRKGFRFMGEVRVEAGAGSAPLATPAAPRLPAPTLPDRPSIAVLPFQNMGGNADDEYFADGMVEDIITALSRFKSLFVIARNSSFTYKGRGIDIEQVGRELGVRYVLKGSVRRAGGQLRITGQLIDGTTGAHLWAERFDGSLEDVFDLQDRVTASVVGAVAPRLDQAEIERAKHKPVENLDAYDSFLRGMARAAEHTKESWEEARRLFYRAIEIDPEFAAPYGMAARCYATRKSHGWTTDGAGEAAEIRRLAERISAIGRDDALALSWAGFGLVWMCREYDNGAALADQALIINQNLAVGWINRGFVSIYCGQHEAAIEQLVRAVRLSPLDPEFARSATALAFANLLQERNDEALGWAARAVAHEPNWMPALWASTLANVFAGNFDEAQRSMTRIRILNPLVRIADFEDIIPFRRQKDSDRVAEGFRLAGLPE